MTTTTTTTTTTTYKVSWQVCVQTRAFMEFEAPAELSEEELKTFIREECSADFYIDPDYFEYDDGFAEVDCDFDIEWVE